MSFFEERAATEGLTFDDVLLQPDYAEVLPREVSIATRFTRNITINAPIVSAAMDTVTEAALAIAIAREGGIGIIHKNMTIERQAKQVRAVKRAENGMIYNPLTISPNATVQDALRIMRENKIGGIPVVEGDKKLAGIVTNRDLRFEDNMQRPVSEVMTQQDKLITISDKKFTSLEAVSEILRKYKIEKLPVVSETNGTLLGLFTFKDLTKVKDNPNASKDGKGRLRVAAGVGVTADAMQRIAALVKAEVDAIAVDTAHGHSKGVAVLLQEVKKTYPKLEVVAGNVATAAAAIMLVEAGADAVKVGIGPGSICTTRVIAGVGVPQLSAIYNVAQALKGTGVPLIADGGIRYSGDMVKALAAGADCIMAGSLFAGAEESPGETVIYNGRKFKTYRGMGSLEAMQQGSKDRYFQANESDIAKLVPEGIAGRVPHKGMLSEIIYQMIGGLRAGMFYCGAKNIEALKKAKFVRITGSGMTESHPHDVTVTSEAPNYSR
ncbi:MAG: IMP dehydrogenase [Prevotellaceae bacterium]|jgi:IMP dehydrogenase|nr:IMP dehydrogenase [Prevotellaceae bacterium]